MTVFHLKIKFGVQLLTPKVKFGVQLLTPKVKFGVQLLIPKNQVRCTVAHT